MQIHKATITKSVRDAAHAEQVAAANDWDLMSVFFSAPDWRAVFFTRPNGFTLAQEQACEARLND